jgi:periplasmic protein TonB
VAAISRNGDNRPARLTLALAITLSALAHIIVIALALFLSNYMASGTKPIPAYTVQIVDNIPAGNLGTRKPVARRSHRPANPNRAATEPPDKNKVVVPQPKPEPKPDKNVIALNTTPKPSPTVAPTPTPTPTAEPTEAPTPTAVPTPPQTSKREKHQPKTKEKKPKARKRENPPSEIVKPRPTPSVDERLARLKQELLAEQLNRKREEADDKEEQAEEKPEEETNRREAANSIEGEGVGVGPGNGSLGTLKDPLFLLYYRTVQEQIKKAWSFSGPDSELTTSALFAIGPDGQLTGVKITRSSHDPSYDQSVIRAIRRAAPFPAPPERFRSQFGQGVEAVFRLAEMKS